VEFSPFHARRLAVATAQYFGIIGNGRWVGCLFAYRIPLCSHARDSLFGLTVRIIARQYVLELGLDGILHVVRDFLTQEVSLVEG